MVLGVQGRGRKPKKPDWAEITPAADVSDWVDPNRLPPPPFDLMSPMLMKPDRLIEFTKYIIQGEMGLIDNAKRFRWKGQVDGAITVPRQ